jgi:hypothetical protein
VAEYRGTVVPVAWAAAFLGPGLGCGALIVLVGDRYPFLAIGLWACVVCSVLGLSLMLVRRARGDITYGMGESISRWAAISFFGGFLGSLSIFVIAALRGLGS